MPSFLFDSPLAAGKCSTALAITTVASTIDFKVNDTVSRTGTLECVLVADIDWLYSDTPGSGRFIPVKAGQPLTLPMYDNLVIEATAVGGAGLLGAMLAEGE
jgi:hypothetical protein